MPLLTPVKLKVSPTSRHVRRIRSVRRSAQRHQDTVVFVKVFVKIGVGLRWLGSKGLPERSTP